MNKTLLIIRREYLSRVKKKSFIIMSIVGPLLIALVVIVPVLLSQITDESKTIGVVDVSGKFEGKFPDRERMKFEYIQNVKAEDAPKKFWEYGYDAILLISAFTHDKPDSVVIYSEKQVSISITEGVKRTIENEIRNARLAEAGIQKSLLDSIKKIGIEVKSNKIDKLGKIEESSVEATTVVGYIGGFAIYIFIFIYGAMVMRGVIEEKTSRIVEVIVSSVRPFQLMMGKIIGIAIVGLTQFLLWIVLSFVIITGATAVIGGSGAGQEKMVKEMVKNRTQIPVQGMEQQPDETAETIGKVQKAIYSLPLVKIILLFIFYFLGGYLLYSALFAAIGAAVDNETEVQQFMLPITIPIILSIIMAQFVITSPDGPVAFWFSMIPLTSPIIMMVRIPFEVAWWEIALSMALLVLGFLGTVWLAGRIYRTGILMYGKKITYRELGKWLFYKG
jgi:ABC-2 type transport system permease protein